MNYYSVIKKEKELWDAKPQMNSTKIKINKSQSMEMCILDDSG